MGREKEHLLTNFNGPSMVINTFRYSLSFNFYNSSVRHQNAHKDETLRLSNKTQFTQLDSEEQSLG